MNKKGIYCLLVLSLLLLSLGCIEVIEKSFETPSLPSTIPSSIAFETIDEEFETIGYLIGVVTNVVDGDTIDVDFEGWSIERVRFIGVDTPESRGKNYPEKFYGIPEDRLKIWGKEAKRFSESSLLNKKVRIEKDLFSDTRGWYGRLLGYVVVENFTAEEKEWNTFLVKIGYARVYRKADCEIFDWLVSLEEIAIEKRIGVWSELDE